MRAARSVAMLALGCCWAAILEELEVSLDGAPAYFDSVASDDTEALQTKALAFTEAHGLAEDDAAALVRATLAGRPAPVGLVGDVGDANPYARLLWAGSRTMPFAYEVDEVARARAAVDDGEVLVVHFHWLRTLPVAALEAWARWLRRPRGAVVVAWTVHNVVEHDATGARRRAELDLRAELAARADLVHVMCACDLPYALPGDARIIPHGSYVGSLAPVSAADLTSDRTAVRRQMGLPPDATVVVAFGRMRRYKGLSTLVEAFAASSNADLWLWVVGTPAEDYDLEADLAALPLERRRRVVTLAADVADASLGGVFAAADAAFFGHMGPSALNSGAAHLALSFGCPVVLRNVACLADLARRAAASPCAAEHAPFAASFDDGPRALDEVAGLASATARRGARCFAERFTMADAAAAFRRALVEKVAERAQGATVRPAARWVAGLPRSGTNYVAAVVGGALTGRDAHGERHYLHEPLNVDARDACTAYRRGDVTGHYAWDGHAAGAVDAMLTECTARYARNGTVVVQESVGVFSVPLVMRPTDRLLYVARHPLAWAASMRKAWAGLDCRSRSHCGEDRVVRQLVTHAPRALALLARDGAAFRGAFDALGPRALNASNPDAGLDALCLLWALFAARVDGETVVRLEDLALAPHGAWRRVGAALGVEPGAARRRLQPARDDIYDRTSVQDRDAAAELYAWRRDEYVLEERARVVGALTGCGAALYPEPFWWGAYADAAPPRFVEVTADVGLDVVRGPGLGLSVGDPDGDGFPDLLAPFHYDGVFRPHGNYPPPTLFRNVAGMQGERRFAAVPLDSIVAGLEFERCVEACLNRDGPADVHLSAFVDLDGDGDDDLMLVTGGGMGVGRAPHVIAWNRGNGTYAYDPRAFRPANISSMQRGRHAFFRDLDGDARLDVLVSGAARPEPPLDAALYAQSDGGAFVAAHAHPLCGGENCALEHLPSENAFAGAGGTFRLRGDATIEVVAVAENPCVVECYEWYSYVGAYCCARAAAFDRPADGLGALVSAAAPTPRHRVACALVLDADNDGRDDLFVAYVHAIREDGVDAVPDLRGVARVFMRTEDGWESASVLFEGLSDVPLHNLEKCVQLDHDLDGRMDVAMSSGPFLWYSGDPAITKDPGLWTYGEGRVHLLRNVANSGNRYLVLDVRGDGRDVPGLDVGARVEVAWGGRARVKVVDDGVAGLAQNDKRLHFGLGRATAASFQVRWTDGVVTAAAAPCLDCAVRVARGARGSVDVVPLPSVV